MENSTKNEGRQKRDNTKRLTKNIPVLYMHMKVNGRIEVALPFQKFPAIIMKINTTFFGEFFKHENLDLKHSEN